MDAGVGLPISPPSNATAYLNISPVLLANLTEAMSLTQAEIGIVVSNTRSYLKENIINLALLTMFFGLFTVLAGVAAYVLLSKGIKQKAPASMLIAIIAMWTSTVVYWIVTSISVAYTYFIVRDSASQSFQRITDMQACLPNLFPGADTATSSNCPFEVLSSSPPTSAAYPIRDCAGTVALTVNVIIGDSIVWWRAWVLWPNNKIVRCICIVMILLTLAMGTVDTKDACTLQALFQLNDDPVRSGESGLGPEGVGFTNGTMFSGDVWGLVVGISSLLTNVVATTLIAYRAWEHRRIIMSYLRESSRRTKVTRTLALLVESGLLYCALWVTIVIYELSYVSPTTENSTFAAGFYYVVVGCLVPLIGMYPTLIIIICAIDKSLYEKSADDAARNTASMVFNVPRARSRRHSTLSELISISSTDDAHDSEAESVGGPPAILEDTPKEGGASHLLPL